MRKQYKTRAKYKDGRLIPLEELDLINDMEVEIIIIEDTEGPINTNDLMKLTEKNKSFDFLNNPKEDIYIPEKIKPIKETKENKGESKISNPWLEIAKIAKPVGRSDLSVKHHEILGDVIE